MIIAKTQLTELANWVAGSPTPMPGNYNAVGGFGMNPYDPRRDPREGSNDGRPVMADRRIQLGSWDGFEFLGGECGDGDFGVDPVAVESEHAGGDQAYGGAHQPIWRDSDYGGSGYGGSDGEERDGCGDYAGGARERCARSERCGDFKCPPGRDYTRFLKADGLKGARIGIPRAAFYTVREEGRGRGGRGGGGGLNAEQAK